MNQPGWEKDPRYVDLSDFLRASLLTSAAPVTWLSTLMRGSLELAKIARFCVEIPTSLSKAVWSLVAR